MSSPLKLKIMKLPPLIAKLLSWVISTILISVLGFLFLLKSHNNFSMSFVVRTGSMQPTLPVGSLVITQRAQAYNIGDIITFKRHTVLVTHRIVRQMDKRFITQGDANNVVDSEPVALQDIVGKVRISLPFAGKILLFIKTPLGFMVAILAPALLIIIQEIAAIGREIERMKLAKQRVMKKVLDMRANTSTADTAKQVKAETQANRSRLTQSVTLFIVMLLVTTTATHAFFSDLGQSTQNTFSAGQFGQQHLLINEIYFNVDAAHGSDCNPASLTLNTNTNNTNTGPNSTNENTSQISETTNSQVINNAVIDTQVSVNQNSGNNTTVNYTQGNNGQTGDNNLSLQITNNANNAFAQGPCNEWIELYNPTNQDISLKDWQVMDNSGIARVIHANKTIVAGEFALLTKSASTFSLFWTVPPTVPIIELGSAIGDGLGNTGDHLQLFDPSHQLVDAIAWGTDGTVPQYTGPLNAGQSLQRLPSGLDTDQGTDFSLTTTPTPGQ